MLGDFAAAAQARGWLRLRFLEVNGQAVAVLLGWRIGERYAFYSGGFDPLWAKHSVGMLLVARVIREAIEEDAAEFDMLLGGEQYKSRFTDLYREAITVTLVPAVSPLRFVFAGEAAARRFGRRFADGPAGGILRSLAKRIPTSSRA
jgi:CelD/BcsL family acetyltransferase involved in cellulose biosynthesis